MQVLFKHSQTHKAIKGKVNYFGQSFTQLATY